MMCEGIKIGWWSAAGQNAPVYFKPLEHVPEHIGIFEADQTCQESYQMKFWSCMGYACSRGSLAIFPVVEQV